MKGRQKILFLCTTLAIVAPVCLAGCNDRQKEAGSQTTSATIGTTVEDDIITTKIKSGLLAETEVKSFDIKVETRKGKVEVSGFANTQSQIDRVVEIARRVEGVTEVENKMSVKR